MKIAEIYVDGFKNIVDTRLKLNGVDCLISPNNYGKSNLFHAITNGFRFIHSNPAKAGSFFSPGQNMPLLKSDFGKKFSFEIVLADDEKTVTYGYSYHWAKSHIEPGMIGSEYLKVKYSDSRKARTYIDRSHPLSFRCLISPNSSTMDRVSITVDELALWHLLSTGKSFFDQILRTIHSCAVYIDTVEDPLNTPIFDLSMNPPPPEGPFKMLSGALAHFFESTPGNRDNLVEAMKSLFPDLIDISAEKGVLTTIDGKTAFESRPAKPGENVVSTASVSLRQFDYPIDLSMMSTGFKRILAFLLHVFQAQERDNILLAIEEPENAIHPSLLENFVEYLKTINEKATIILSSHSPFIVNALVPSSIYVGLPKEDGTATFAPFKKGKEKALSHGASDFGLPTGSYIFELLGGDEYSRSLLSSYLDR